VVRGEGRVSWWTENNASRDGGQRKRERKRKEEEGGGWENRRVRGTGNPCVGLGKAFARRGCGSRPMYTHIVVAIRPKLQEG
jgi:hypothetical protein